MLPQLPPGGLEAVGSVVGALVINVAARADPQRPHQRPISFLRWRRTAGAAGAQNGNERCATSLPAAAQAQTHCSRRYTVSTHPVGFEHVGMQHL